MSKKVLYCGMADDILTPLLLVPELTHLYVIDSFDRAFARRDKITGIGTWETQKKDIKTILSNGHDEESGHIDVQRHYNKKYPITKLEESCTLLEETDSNKRWYLAFKYKGIRRELIYFHQTNFYDKWNSEIIDVGHLMSIGAVFMDGKGGGSVDNKEFFETIKKRTTDDCLYYDGYNTWNVQYNLYEHKKDYIIKEVRNNEIIISKLKYELNR